MSDLYDYAKQAGQWISDRGNSMHGVTDPKDSAIHDPVPEYLDPDGGTEYPGPIPQANELEPIPVRIVEPVDRSRQTRVKFRTSRDSAPPGGTLATIIETARPLQILGQDDSRILARIKPIFGSATIVILDDPNGQVNQGWELEASGDEVFETRSQAAVYALALHDTNSSPLTIYTEYTVDIDGE